MNLRAIARVAQRCCGDCGSSAKNGSTPPPGHAWATPSPGAALQGCDSPSASPIRPSCAALHWVGANGTHAVFVSAGLVALQQRIKGGSEQRTGRGRVEGEAGVSLRFTPCACDLADAVGHPRTVCARTGCGVEACPDRGCYRHRWPVATGWPGAAGAGRPGLRRASTGTCRRRQACAANNHGQACMHVLSLERGPGRIVGTRADQTACPLA